MRMVYLLVLQIIYSLLLFPNGLLLVADYLLHPLYCLLLPPQLQLLSLYDYPLLCVNYHQSRLLLFQLHIQPQQLVHFLGYEENLVDL